MENHGGVYSSARKDWCSSLLWSCRMAGLPSGLVPVGGHGEGERVRPFADPMDQARSVGTIARKTKGANACRNRKAVLPQFLTCSEHRRRSISRQQRHRSIPKRILLQLLQTTLFVLLSTSARARVISTNLRSLIVDGHRRARRQVVEMLDFQR